MTVTCPHIRGIARAVQSGSHVVVRGQIGDEVLLEGRIVTEDFAIESALRTETGIGAVILADRADGLRCSDPADDDRVSAALGEAGEGGELGVEGPFDIAQTVRALMRQASVPVAVIFRDPELLLARPDQQTDQAIAVLREAMDEAARHPRNDGAPSPRNAVILKAGSGGGAVDFIAALPGLTEVRATLPDRASRRAALEVLRPGFYRAAEADDAELDRGLESLARATHGSSTRELEQIRTRSHVLKIPATRPEALYRSARGELGRTPIDRIGVDAIMGLIEARIAGQPAALAKVRWILERGRARTANREPGVTDDRPLATMLLHGAPGVGKTELAQILAEAICGTREELVRIDCAEYQGTHDSARITGAPPGYVGYEAGGALHDALQRPAAVILFDEFNRAQGRLEELLLGVFDYGRLTDGRGRTGSFRNAVVLLTTNKSTEMLSDRIGSTPPPTDEFLEMSTDAIERALTTEREQGGIGSGAFHSRLRNSLVGFDYLRGEAIEQIVSRSCRNIALNLADELDVHLDFDVEAFSRRSRQALGPDGGWDGRRARVEIDRTIEVPARQAIEATGLEPGGGAVVTPSGMDDVRLQAMEPAAT